MSSSWDGIAVKKEMKYDILLIYEVFVQKSEISYVLWLFKIFFTLSSMHLALFSLSDLVELLNWVTIETMKCLGPVVQSIISLTSPLVVKMLTVLVSTISNSQVFLLKKMWVAFANAKATHIFFSKNIGLYAIFNDQSFNDMLTNNIVSFEQLGPGWWMQLSIKSLLFQVQLTKRSVHS